MSVADMVEMESLLDEVRDQFEDDLRELLNEDPGMFEGRSTQEEWNAQVRLAANALREELNKSVDKIETMLHDGQYH